MRRKVTGRVTGALFALAVVGQAGGIQAEAEITITRLDPRFDQIAARDAAIEKIADGLTWVEGPLWNKQGGYLLFSDTTANSVYKWKAGEGVSLFLKRSGYTGAASFTGKEPGSNGLAFDATGRLVLCQHGDRRVARLEDDGRFTTLANGYGGYRFNSPNDLVFKSNGDLYFTDPPFGLPKGFDDPEKAPVQGVYRLSKEGTVTLLITDIKVPNGIAFSPDETILYVSDDDPDRPAWLAYDVNADGTVENGRVLSRAIRPFSAPDGFKVDQAGNIFGSRSGGVSVIAPDGTLLGTIETGKATSNVAWGEDGHSLFITASDAVYRIRLLTTGIGY